MVSPTLKIHLFCELWVHSTQTLKLIWSMKFPLLKPWLFSVSLFSWNMCENYFFIFYSSKMFVGQKLGKIAIDCFLSRRVNAGWAKAFSITKDFDSLDHLNDNRPKKMWRIPDPISSSLEDYFSSKALNNHVLIRESVNHWFRSPSGNGNPN